MTTFACLCSLTGFNGFEKEDGSGECDLNDWVDPGADAKLIENKWYIMKNMNNIKPNSKTVADTH